MNPAQKALWFIESHLADALTLDEIAAIGGVSRAMAGWRFGCRSGSKGVFERKPAPVRVKKTRRIRTLGRTRGCLARSLAADCLASARGFAITARNEIVARAE